MPEALVVALSPFALNAIMGLIKWLSAMPDNGQVGAKRFFLALFSLVGVIAFSAMTGNPVDPNSITSLLQIMIETFVVFIASHGSYMLFWNKKPTRNEPIADLLAE